MNINNNEFRKYAIQHRGISSLVVDSYARAHQHQINSPTPYIIEERLAERYPDGRVLRTHGRQDHLSWATLSTITWPT